MRNLGWKTVCLIILGMILFLWLSKAQIFASYLSHRMRVPVSVEWLELSPSTVSLHDFSIDNPRGFREDGAFGVESTQISYRWREVFANHVNIDRIQMQNVFLDVELISGSKNNWTVISDNIKPRKSKEEIVIHQLSLDNINISISGPQMNTIEKHVDHLELYDINSKTGFPTEEVIHQIFGSAGIGEYIQNAFNPAELLEKAIDPFSGL